MNILIILALVLAFITVTGHLIWLAIAGIARWLRSDDPTTTNIHFEPRPDSIVAQLDDLTITERQVARFYSDGKLSDQTYEQLLSQIRAERNRLLTPEAATPRKPPRPAEA